LRKNRLLEHSLLRVWGQQVSYSIGKRAMDTDQEFAEFLLWEATTRDTIDFKKSYVDMAGDLVAGLLLSQIVFWTLPDREGQSKLRVQRDGHMWIAKGRNDWWDEIRITARQFDRAAKILEKKSLIVTGVFRFAGLPTKHIRLEPEGFLDAWKSVLTQSVKTDLHKVSKRNNAKSENEMTQSVKTKLHKAPKRDDTKRQNEITQSEKPITEPTTETTTELTAETTTDSDAAVVVSEMMGFGIDEEAAWTLAESREAEQVYGWIDYARGQENLTNPAGFVVSRLRAGTPAPQPENDADVRARYTSQGTEYEGLVQH